MKSINISFMQNSKILIASMNIPDKSTIGKLKESLKTKIDVFHYGDLLMIEEHADGNFEILEDSKTVASLSSKGEINLKAMPRFVLCVFKTVDSYVQKQIDVLKPVFNIIFDVINEFPLNYNFGFQYQKEGKENLSYKMCAFSLPLCVQGWFHDTIFLIKKIPILDIWDFDDSVIANYIENCRFAHKLSISAYPVDVWGQLAAYQFLSEKIPSITESYVRQNISRCVSPAVKISSESELIERTVFHIRRCAKLDSKSALQHYFNTLVNDGCQCAFMEKVKFKVVGSLFSARRYLYITSEKIWIAKDLSTNITELGKTPEIVGTMFDGENLLIEFVTHTKWAIKTSRPKVIKSVIDEIIHDSFKDFQMPKSTEESDEIHENMKHGTLPYTEGALAAVAPIHKIDNSDDSNSMNNFLNFSAHSLSVSTYQLLAENTEKHNKSGNRVRTLKRVPKCVPKITIPDMNEPNDVVDMKKKAMSVITITNPVDETSNQINETYILPTQEQFFEYNGYEELTNNKALLLWLIIIVFIISVTRWLGGPK